MAAFRPKTKVKKRRTRFVSFGSSAQRKAGPSSRSTWTTNQAVRRTGHNSQAMMTDAAQRTFDVLLFWALDRFSREGDLKRLDDAGVRFRSFTEPHLDSCGMFRDAVISILAVIAKQERLRLRDRVIAGLRRAQESGTRSGRPVGRPKAVFRRDQAIELRREGQSWSQVAKLLGISVTSVRRACQNPKEPIQ